MKEVAKRAIDRLGMADLYRSLNHRTLEWPLAIRRDGCMRMKSEGSKQRQVHCKQNTREPPTPYVELIVTQDAEVAKKDVPERSRPLFLG